MATPAQQSRPDRKRDARIAVALTLIALAYALATFSHWTSDDAFISFRYAENLLAGNGLVFNAGERVEAYSNFLWTLWSAAGLALGFGAERWASSWGALLHLATIALLAWNHRRVAAALPGVPGWLPLAALGAALFRDGSLFATSGLETPLFTFLLLAGVLTLVWGDRGRTLAAAGVLLGLAAWTRPEGALAVVIAGAALPLVGRRRQRNALLFALPPIVMIAAHLIWRHAYYGDWLPNTYYAKSAWLPWYDQGFAYARLFFERYWPLLAAPLLLAAGAVRSGRDSAAIDHRVQALVVLAGAMALAFTFYVVRVGGDFMFARFLVPTTPFLLLLLELGWLVAFRGLRGPGLVAAATLLAGMAFTPTPVSGTRASRGVVDEHAYYSPERVALLDRRADILRRTLDGVQVRVAFYGDEARVVYRAGFPVAIEAHASLTEPEIARRPLARRGRPGHEKPAPARYLIEERKADITFSGVPQRLLRLAEEIPEVIVEFDGGVTGQLLRWRADFVAELRSRGVRVPPFEAMLDGYVARIEDLPRERVEGDYARFRRFYFDATADPVREAPFRTRLARPNP